MADFLEARNYSRSFVDDFLLPALAGICTCTYDSVRDYPADVVVDYFSRGLFFGGVRRVSGGTKDVVDRLTQNVERVFTGVEVQHIRPSEGSVEVGVQDGVIGGFDHVVISTQANQAIRLLGDNHDQEKKILQHFPYEKSRVLMHRDSSLAPSDRGSWSSVNFLTQSGSEKPMATIWMNKVQPALFNQSDIFQTWNPLIEPRDDLILSDVIFERPVVNSRSIDAIRELKALHAVPGRRIWFSGSYAHYGIPLLESAVVSSSQIGASLGAPAPWA